MTVSGSIGRKTPTRSPGRTPSARNIRAARSTAAFSAEFVSRRTEPSSPSQTIASPSASRAARGTVAAVAWLNAPPAHQVAHSGPRASSIVESGGRCQSRARSPTAANQNHAGSSTALAWSLSRSFTPVARRRLASRESARSSGVGRQAASGTSRPKIGARAIVTQRAYATVGGAAGLTADTTKLPSTAVTIGGVARTHHGPTLPDMFNRHRTVPESTRRAPALDERQRVAVLERTDAPGLDRAAVRARLTRSATGGLRDRLARPALAAQR